jgi:hypothetical protein
MSTGRVYKLREKSQEEQGCFGIEQIDENALSKNVQKPSVAAGGLE